MTPITKKRKFKCEGCGKSRACYLEMNQDSFYAGWSIEENLICVLDATNKTGFSWEEQYETI